MTLSLPPKPLKFFNFGSNGVLSMVETVLFSISKSFSDGNLTESIEPIVTKQL